MWDFTYLKAEHCSTQSNYTVSITSEMEIDAVNAFFSGVQRITKPEEVPKIFSFLKSQVKGYY